MKLRFVTSLYLKKDSDIIIFSPIFGRDAEKSYRALRRASLHVEPFDERGRNLLENVKIYDEGNLKLKYLDQIYEKVLKLRSKQKIPFMISRNHVSTLFALGAFPERIKIVVFDAHLDAKDRYMDEKIKEMDEFEDDVIGEEINDATWLRRFVDYSYNTKVLVVGARSFCDEEIRFFKEEKLKYFTVSQIKENFEKIKKKIENFTKNSEIYVSLDVDVFDPSVAPAVDYPEPNGIFLDDFFKLVEAIKGKIVGLDTCCFKKNSGSEISEFLIVKAIFKMLNQTSKNM
jgi:agmatinase